MSLLITKSILEKLLRKIPKHTISSAYTQPNNDEEESDVNNIQGVKKFLESSQNFFDDGREMAAYGDMYNFTLADGPYVLMDKTKEDALYNEIIQEADNGVYNVNIKMREPQLSTGVVFNFARTKETYQFDGKRIHVKPNSENLIKSINGYFLIYDYEANPGQLKDYIKSCMEMLVQKENKRNTAEALEVWDNFVNFIRANEAIMPLEDLNIVLDSLKDCQKYTIIYDLSFLVSTYLKNYIYKIDLDINDLVNLSNYIPTLAFIDSNKAFKLGTTFLKICNKITNNLANVEVIVNQLLETPGIPPISRIIMIYYLSDYFRTYTDVRIIEKLFDDFEITPELLASLPFCVLFMVNKLKKRALSHMAHKLDFDLQIYFRKHCVIKNVLKELPFFINQLNQLSFLSVKITYENDPLLFEYFDSNFLQFLDYVDEIVETIMNSKVPFPVNQINNMVENKTIFLMYIFLLHFEVLLSTKSRIYKIFHHIQNDKEVRKHFVNDEELLARFHLSLKSSSHTKYKMTLEEEKNTLMLLETTKFKDISELLANRRFFSLHLALRFEKKLMKDFMSLENPKAKLIVLKSLMNMNSLMVEHYEIINDYLRYVDYETLDIVDLYLIFTKSIPKLISKDNLCRLFDFFKPIYSEKADEFMEKKLLMYDIEEKMYGKVKNDAEVAET